MNESVGKRRKSKYICTECDVAFELFTYFESRRKHCPKCGDFIAVTTLEEKGLVTGEWVDKEIEWIDQYIYGHITMDDLVKLTRRKRKQIYDRKFKRVKELGVNKRKYIPWETSEKDLLEQCINGKISLEDLIDLIDNRTRNAVEMQYYRRVKKLRELHEVKQNV